MSRRLLTAGMLASLLSPALVAQSLNDSRLRLSQWASGLDGPTTFAWIGPGEMLVIEKDTGRVKRVENGTLRNTVLDLNVAHDAERGGLGIAVDPDFADNSYVYLYYSATSGSSDTSGSWTENRVDRYTWDGTNLVSGTGPLISFAMDSAQGGNGPSHDGGVIRFGPDGKLYGVAGDLNRGRIGGSARVEQNTATSGSARVGGVFRLNPDGSVPTDNPFINETDSNLHVWYSYGLRNSFGVTFDPITGTLWYTDNGPDQWDEIDRCPPGMNGGWLKIMGPDSRDATYVENNNTKYDANQLVYLGGAVYVDPEFTFKHCCGITAIQFIHSKRFPEDLQDNVFVGDNNSGNLYYFVLKNQRTEFVLTGGVADKVADTAAEAALVIGGVGFSVITDIQVGSDGYLYLINYGSGIVHRIRPVTDLLEPSSFVGRLTTRLDGPITNLERSDDRYVRLKAQPGIVNPGFVRAEATFLLNELTPTAVTLDVETHCDTNEASDSILALNQITGRWDVIDSRRAKRVDNLRTLTLSNPANYVKSDKSIRIRIDAVGVGGGGSAATPVLFIDQMRMNVTYP
jgi:glucose/arabinose dehydrogenase